MSVHVDGIKLTTYFIMFFSGIWRIIDVDFITPYWPGMPVDRWNGFCVVYEDVLFLNLCVVYVPTLTYGHEL